MVCYVDVWTPLEISLTTYTVILGVCLNKVIIIIINNNLSRYVLLLCMCILILMPENVERGFKSYEMAKRPEMLQKFITNYSRFAQLKKSISLLFLQVASEDENAKKLAHKYHAHIVMSYAAMETLLANHPPPVNFDQQWEIPITVGTDSKQPHCTIRH